MNAVLIDRNLGYPKSFYQRLNDLNSEKLPISPVALILKASSREACLADMPRITQMARTHRVVLQELNQNRSIGKNIQEAFEKTGMRPKKLVCFSHALDPTRIEVGVEPADDGECIERVYTYSSKGVKKEDFLNLDKDAQIFLSGCETGDGKDSLARRIAEVSGRAVFAPKGLLNRAATCFLEYPDKQWEMLSYLPGKGMQHVYKFMPDGSSQISSKETLMEAIESREEVRRCFASYAQSMEKYALMGNAKARIIMADFCNTAIPGCIEEDAVHWLLSAALEHNDSEAQYELGCWYDPSCSRGNVEKSFENALYWFQSAADQGHLLAQYNTGMYLLHGRGCEKSESRAVHYFQLAADQGYPKALEILGQCSERGIGGLPLSLQSALFYYALAAKRGYEPAQRQYHRLHLELELDEVYFDLERLEEKVEKIGDKSEKLRQELEELQISYK